MPEPTEREPMSDAEAALRKFVRNWGEDPEFEIHLRDGELIPHLVAFLAESKRTRSELSARLAAESADAAAGSYAGRAEAAEARAEQAEAALKRLELVLEDVCEEADKARDERDEAQDALAELRERLGEEWGVANEAFASIPFPSKAHAQNALRTWNANARYPWRLMVRDLSEWRDADATPRTALERAADEQGSAREQFEGFLTKDGRREVAEFMAEARQEGDDIDIDEVIAQNHRDAMRDWGIADA